MIALRIGRCVDEYDQPTDVVSGGMDTFSRLHVEEVRRGHVTDAGLLFLAVGSKFYIFMQFLSSNFSRNI